MTPVVLGNFFQPKPEGSTSSWYLSAARQPRAPCAGSAPIPASRGQERLSLRPTLGKGRSPRRAHNSFTSFPITKQLILMAVAPHLCPYRGADDSFPSGFSGRPSSCRARWGTAWPRQPAAPVQMLDRSFSQTQPSLPLTHGRENRDQKKHTGKERRCAHRRPRQSAPSPGAKRCAAARAADGQAELLGSHKCTRRHLLLQAALSHRGQSCRQP